MAGRVGSQRGPGFDRQGVGTYVGRGRVEGQHGLQRGTPVGQGLPGGTEDEVHAVGTGETGLTRQPGGAGHRRRVVLAAECRQHVGDHRLGAEGQPGHPAGPPGGQFGGRDGLRVALHRHFGPRGHAYRLG